MHRKLLNPTFNVTIVKKFFPTFNECSKRLVEALQQEVGKCNVDIKQIFGIHSIRQQLRTLFGTDMEEEQILRIFQNNEW